jgi:hypothetical protein
MPKKQKSGNPPNHSREGKAILISNGQIKEISNKTNHYRFPGKISFFRRKPIQQAKNFVKVILGSENSQLKNYILPTRPLIRPDLVKPS